MKTKNIFSISFWALCSTLVAQDLHFSNPEYSPLILNPALAGANSGMQANLNYRTQWGKLGDHTDQRRPHLTDELLQTIQVRTMFLQLD